MNGALAMVPISWLGSMLSGGEVLAAAPLDAAVTGTASNFASQLAALRLPTAASGALLRIGGDVSSHGPTDLENVAAEQAALATLIAALPAATATEEPHLPWFGGALHGAEITGLGEATTRATIVAADDAPGVAPVIEERGLTEIATQASGSSLGAILPPAALPESTVITVAAPLTYATATAQEAASAAPLLTSSPLQPPTMQSLVFVQSSAVVENTDSTSASDRSTTDSDRSIGTEVPSLLAEGSTQTLAALAVGVATSTSPASEEGPPALAGAQAASERAAALEVSDALELLEVEADLESIAGESSPDDAPVEELQTRPSLQNLAAVAQGVQIEVQRGRDAQAPENRAWKLTAGDVGRRAAAHTRLPLRAVTATSTMARLQGPAHDADTVASTKPSAAPFTAPPEASQPTVNAGGKINSPATALPPVSSSMHAAARTTQTDGDQVDAPRAVLAHSLASDTPSAALRGPSALDTNTNLHDLGARLRLAVADVIVDAGRDRLLGSVRDAFQARVTVHPPNLGTVQVQVTRESATSGLNILLVAAHQEGARALESEADHLIDDLVRHRLEVNEVNVRRGEGGTTDQQREGQQRPSAQDQNARERREQQQAQERADDRDPRHRRSPDARWDFASSFVPESISQDAQGSDRP